MSWHCEICGGDTLEPALQRNVSRCARCHVEYYTMDEKGRKSSPICSLAGLALECIKYAWETYKVTLEEIMEEELYIRREHEQTT